MSSSFEWYVCPRHSRGALDCNVGNGRRLDECRRRDYRQTFRNCEVWSVSGRSPELASVAEDLLVGLVDAQRLALPPAIECLACEPVLRVEHECAREVPLASPGLAHLGGDEAQLEDRILAVRVALNRRLKRGSSMPEIADPQRDAS